jgi:serine/threonine protein kinase
MDDASPGARIGPCEISGPLGSGGMGQVTRARDTRLGREVAIKLSKEELSERFEREVEERCSWLCGTCSEMGELVKWANEECESG